MRQERVTRKPGRRATAGRAASRQPQSSARPLRRPAGPGDAELDELLARIDRMLSGSPTR